MKQTRPTLDDLRRETTTFQKRLLQEIWEHFRAKAEWPNLRTLYKDHGKTQVKEALMALTGNVGWEEGGPQRWSRYRLSLLGAFLTSDGQNMQTLMARLFQFQRDLFQTEPERSEADSAELTKVLRLAPEETTLLGQLLHLGNFGGSQNPAAGSWRVSALEEAADFPKTGDLFAQVGEWACKFYRPDSVALQEQRNAQLSGAPLSANLEPATGQPHPPEIAMSLERLRGMYPDPKKLGFLVMRFTGGKPFQRIVDVIKRTALEHGLVVVRADENEFHADLWGNVRTLLHGCGFGIAVYERIETNEPNANVGLEVGYLMAMNKPVLLLKDKTVQALQTDLTGKLYKPFDPHDPEANIPDQLTNWLADNGIIVPKRR